MNSGIVRFKAFSILRKNFKKDLKNLNILEQNKNNNKDLGFKNNKKNKKKQNKKKSSIKNTNNLLKHF